MDEFDSDSTEETVGVPLLIHRRGSKKVFDQDILSSENKYKSKEYEQILKKESSTSQFDKFDLYFQDSDEAKIFDKNRCSSFKKSSLKNSQNSEDEYNFLKSASVQIEDDEKKIRSSSILKRLESNLIEKK